MKLRFVFILLCSPAFGQTHNPSLTVDGDEVTIDAQIAVPSVAAQLVRGTTLSQAGVFQSSDGSSPIVLRLPAGVHTVTAWGFPDSVESQDRNQRTLTATVGQPDRIQLLVRWYGEYFVRAGQWREAVNEIAALQPTKDEIVAALTALSGN